jgi:hypothetical protein
MNKKLIQTDVLIRALLKLDQETGERRNVLLFIQSCYGCRVLSYDFDAALKSLAKLTDREQNALIMFVLRFS